jgi:hypothetical protein
MIKGYSQKIRFLSAPKLAIFDHILMTNLHFVDPSAQQREEMPSIEKTKAFYRPRACLWLIGAEPSEDL